MNSRICKKKKKIIQIEYKVILETFLRWVRTSANFKEVPWLSFEPKVSKLPSAWNNYVSGTFLTAESFSEYLNEPNSFYHFNFLGSLKLFYEKSPQSISTDALIFVISCLMWILKKANQSLPVSFYFSPNKGPNNGNQHCWKEIGDLDSFAPDEIDPYTENEAGAN